MILVQSFHCHLVVVNLRQITYEIHKVDSPLPTNFFPVRIFNSSQLSWW